jgi:hypothetical protein
MDARSNTPYLQRLRTRFAARQTIAANCLVALAMLIGTHEAWAEWAVVTRNAANGATTSYDTARARQSGNLLEMWTRADGAGHKPVITEHYRRNSLSPGQAQGFEERFAYRLTKWRVDCAKWTQTVLAVADYDANGEAFYSNEARGEEGVIYPDSVVDAGAMRLCPKPRSGKK